MKMIVDQKKLDLYVNKNFNVLFEGERGVGKTSIIYKTFEKAGLRVKYFSAPTMDPWTDLVGVPKNVVREDGKEVLRMIPPEDFVDDHYDVLFIDELNRAPSKVLNAVMELIQFRSINGRKYNIKMIWAAINPHSDNDDYQVEKLDKALEDRFQIKIKFPYKVDQQFFEEQHGQIGTIFCTWWNNQPENIQKEISPRRLFETASFYKDGGDIADMITVGNVDKLKEDLKTASVLIILENDFNNKSISKKTENILSLNYSATLTKYLLSSSNVFEFFFPHLNQEWISTQFTKKTNAYKYVLHLSNKQSPIAEKAKNIVQNIVKVANDSFLKQNKDSLKDFLSPEQVEKIDTISTSNLVTNSLKEANFINLLKVHDYIQPHFSMSDLTHKFNTTKILQNLQQGIKSVDNSFTKERLIEQTSHRLAYLLAFFYSKNNSKLGVSAQKTYDAFLNPSSTSYMWNRKNILSIDSSLKEIGPMLITKFEELKSLPHEEIRELFLFDISKKKPKLKM
jgi:hypothetical protein